MILLVFMQRHMPRAGIGTLVALMLPYALAFAVAWSLLLVLWMGTGSSSARAVRSPTRTRGQSRAPEGLSR